MPLNHLTLKQALDGLKSKSFSIEELVKDLQSASDQQNADLNIFLANNPDQEKQSKQAKDKPLMGIPVAIKDNICTKGIKTTCSAKNLDNFIPQYNATIIHKLVQAGGVIQGKTNLDAWAHGSSTETSYFGRTLNPRNPDFLPGGSSGGSAAAVTSNSSIIAIGTETAGSIRQPSSWCGCVGLKPTYGRCSRYGIASMASSTDSPGPIGKTVEDVAILLQHIAGHDPLDSTSAKDPTTNFSHLIGKSLKDLKIGLLYQDIDELRHVNEHIDRESKIFKKLGASLHPVSALNPSYAIGSYTVIQRAEVSSNLARYDGIRYGHDRTNFGPEARRRITLGTFTLAESGLSNSYYLADKVRTLFHNDFQKLFTKFDLLISPTTPGYAKPIGASEINSVFGELEDMLLEPSSIVGLPGISIPCYHDPQTNLFLGMNIMAPKWKEDLILQVADAFEKNTPWNSWRSQS